MRRSAGFILAAILSGAAFGSALQDAEKAWQQRDQPGQTEAAIQAWQIALQENPVKVDIYIALTRACGRA